MAEKRTDIIEMLKQSYCMELETVMNSLANSSNLDGVRAQQIKQALKADVRKRVSHAQLLGRRIKQLGGLIPGSASVTLGHQHQPPRRTTDVVRVIQGVVAAEEVAFQHYRRIIDAAHRGDPVTVDLCTRLLADIEEHLVLFRGFLKEYDEGRGVDRGDMSARNASRSAAVINMDGTPDEKALLGLS